MSRALVRFRTARPAALAAGLIGILLALGASPASAFPIFARKYQTSCQTCHTIFPKLNPFGQAFRLNGYRMPQEAENPDVVKEPPVSLGSEAYKRVWPEAVYPSTIPAHVPFALNVTMADVYASSLDDGGRTLIQNDFHFPEEANLFAAGTLGDTFSFLGEITYGENPDGSADVEIERAHFGVNSPFGPPHLVNFKVGKFAPGLTDGFHEMGLMTNNGIDSLFTYDPIGANGGVGISDTPLGISLPENIKGIEMDGVAAHRAYYAIGVANGLPGANGVARKDVYARLDYKFGGMGLDGDTTGVTLPPENWRESSLRIGVLGYHGDGSDGLFSITDEEGNAVNIEDRSFDRYGAFASWYWRDLNVFGVAVRGSDDLRLHDPDSGEVLSARKPTWDSWFVQADYVIKPPFQVSLRYEDLRPGDRSVAKQDWWNANFSWLVRANIKTMLEYHRDAHQSQNYEYDAVLRFAF